MLGLRRLARCCGGRRRLAFLVDPPLPRRPPAAEGKGAQRAPEATSSVRNADLVYVPEIHRSNFIFGARVSSCLWFMYSMYCCATTAVELMFNGRGRFRGKRGASPPIIFSGVRQNLGGVVQVLLVHVVQFTSMSGKSKVTGEGRTAEEGTGVPAVVVLCCSVGHPAFALP